MAWRSLERLRVEHGDDGGESIGKDAAREPKLSRQEACLPLRHDPGEMQIDFYVDLSGHRQQVAPFVLSLPTCDARVLARRPPLVLRSLPRRPLPGLPALRRHPDSDHRAG